jgi:RHS repeat-associated protein
MIFLCCCWPKIKQCVQDLLTSYDGQSISYDASGNPTSYLGATLTWTMGRQLASYDKDSLSVDYTYNENGIRTSKTVNNVRTDFYLNGSQVIAEVTNGNRIDYRYDGNSQLIALRYNGNEYYYVTNIQGDIISLIDGSGTSVVQYSYDAWGNQTSCTGTLANTLGQANPYHYRGYKFDSETGLFYVGSRYYDPQIGRFINADEPAILQMTQGQLLGTNLFAYCLNNPVNMSDPTGYLPWYGYLASAAIQIAGLSGIFAASYKFLKWYWIATIGFLVNSVKITAVAGQFILAASFLLTLVVVVACVYTLVYGLYIPHSTP